MESLLLITIVSIIFLIGVLVGGYLYHHRHTAQNKIHEYNQKRRQDREAAKQLIIKLIRSRGSVTNSDVKRFLSVSSRSAHRYLEALEQENKITQHQETGRGVFYSLN